MVDLQESQSLEAMVVVVFVSHDIFVVSLLAAYLSRRVLRVARFRYFVSQKRIHMLNG